jgi:hypothetical protein
MQVMQVMQVVQVVQVVQVMQIVQVMQVIFLQYCDCFGRQSLRYYSQTGGEKRLQKFHASLHKLAQFFTFKHIVGEQGKVY